MAVLFPEPDRPVMMMIMSRFTIKNVEATLQSEYWNYGIMGSGKMEACSVGNVFIESKNRYFENPAVQYSIIPLFQWSGKCKGLVIAICRQHKL
jgi:hypothetical protein